MNPTTEDPIEYLSQTLSCGLMAEDILVGADRYVIGEDLNDRDRASLAAAQDFLRSLNVSDSGAPNLTTIVPTHLLASNGRAIDALDAVEHQAPSPDTSAFIEQLIVSVQDALDGGHSQQTAENLEHIAQLFERISKRQLAKANQLLFSRG